MSARCRANQKKTQEGGALTALCLMFSRDKQVRAVRHLGKDIFQIPNTNGRVSLNEDKETDYISNITPLETQGKVLCLRPAQQGNNIYCIKEHRG